MSPKTGEIYGAYDPTGKKRPVIIVSREDLNEGHYVLAVPLTTQDCSYRSGLPHCVPLQAGRFGLTKDCVAQAEAITLLEKSDLDLDSGPWASLDRATMRSVIHAIGYVIEAECEPT